MNLLVDAEWDAPKVQRVVALFHSLPIDAQDTQLIGGDHHLGNVHAWNALYVTI